MRPNFIFCATDLGHGSPWHFERDLTGSEIEGWFANDDFTIGDAVAASSCFPPVFSPMILKLPQPVGKGSPGPLLIERALYWPDGQANAGHGYVDPRSIEPSREVGERLTSQELLSMSARGTRGAHARSKDTRGGTRSAPNPNQPTIVRRCNEPCTYLSDGGVSDNLGLEVVWRNHGVLLVSNGGQPFRYGWRNSHLRWVLRCTEVAGHQVDRLRVQWLLYLFRKCHRMGAYWGIGNTASSFGSSSQHWPTYSQTSVRNYISRVRTDLDRFTNEESKILENHGYCVAASAIDFHLLRHEPWRKELGISDYGNTNVPHPKLMATNFSDAESVQENDKLVRRHLENSHKRFGRGKPALSD